MIASDLAQRAGDVTLGLTVGGVVVGGNLALRQPGKPQIEGTDASALSGIIELLAPGSAADGSARRIGTHGASIA